MVKKIRPKNNPGKEKEKKPTGRVSLLSNSRRLLKKAARSIKNPAKKKAALKQKLLPVKKKPALKKPAAIKTSRKKPEILLVKKTKKALKVLAVKPDTTFIDTEKLPALYNSTDVTLMVRDPYWIHAYWETTPASLLEVKKELGDRAFKKSAYTLRVHDISATQATGEKARTSFDIDVDPKARNWYINLWRDNATYYADFGVRTPKGAFYPLARSNTVTTPRATTTSEMPDAIWMKVKRKGTFSFVNIQQALPPPPSRGPEQKASGVDSQTIPNAEMAGSAPQGAPQRSMVPEAASLSSDSGQSAIDIAGFMGPDPSLEPPAWGGSSAYMQGGASEQLQERGDFCFELGTDLIVYGRTQPSAQVWFGAKKLPLNEDGSFSLRLALPEGLIPLDFTAQSQDGKDSKTILTAVQRTQTKYL